jgi:hypothetical protein
MVRRTSSRSSVHRTRHPGTYRAWHAQTLIALGLMLAPIQFALSAGFDVTLQVPGGAHRIFRQGVDHPVLEITAWSQDSVSHDVVATFEGFDALSQPEKDPPASVQLHVEGDGSKRSAKVPLPEQIGYYSIFVTVSDGQQSITRSVDLGVVWPPYPGTRPDSFFATNASPRLGEDLQLLETIGMKVQRGHFAPNIATNSKNWPRELPPGEAAPLDFASMDKELNAMRDHGLSVLPIAGNALVGAGVFDRTPLAEQLQMYGPPNDTGRFLRTWEAILRHYPKWTTLEFWNEPWTFGWTWADTPGAYRQLQKKWCEMALGINPHYRLLAGSSVPFVRDEIEPFPDCWKGLLQGISNHPYADGVVDKNFRSGDVFRSIDETQLTARDLKLPYAYLTEGGTAYPNPHSPTEKEQYNNIQNAQKLVQYYVATALAGVFMGNAQWEIGYGPDWTKSNTAFAILTHFLEDRVPLIDLWPRQELMWGGIFANRRFATEEIRSLPRGSELTTRWKVRVPEDRRADRTKVAVLWALTGQSENSLDTHGELVIRNASGLKAYNLMGQAIRPSHGQLVLPLSPSPIYVTSKRLGALALRDRIQSGVIRHLTPLNFYAFSLPDSASTKQKLSVRIQNQINRPLRGTMTLHVYGAKQDPSVPFDIGAGRLKEVRLKWPTTPIRADNRYPIRLTARVSDRATKLGERWPPFSKYQAIAVARFENRTVHFTGALSDWENLVPVAVDSDWFTRTDEAAERLQNPNAQPNIENPKQIAAQVYTAYDDDFVYIGAAVHEDQFQCSAGHPYIAASGNPAPVLPYQEGVPAGLHFITECGSVFQFSFGFRERVPGIGRQMDDPWAWKGDFYDTDYSFVAHTSAQGDRLVRIWGPDGSRKNGYQTEEVPGIGPVPAANLKISRDENHKLTLYEIAIPRRQLKLFDPAEKRCRFGFLVFNRHALSGGALSWSDAAGVFDYWRSAGSFPPTWKSHVACQTFFGIQN